MTSSDSLSLTSILFGLDHCQGSKNRPPSGHLRLKIPFGEWNIPFSGQVGDWKLPFSGQVGDQTFFQGGQRRCGLNVIAQGAWRSLLVQDARELAVRTPLTLIVFVSKSTPGSRCLLDSPIPWDSPFETIWAKWGGGNIARVVTVSLRGTSVIPTWVFFSPGLSGESAPVHCRD